MRHIVVAPFLCLPAKKYRVRTNDIVSCCVLTLSSQARMPHIHALLCLSDYLQGKMYNP